MKKVSLIAAFVATMFLTAACTTNQVAKNFGGSVNVDLPVGQKLENITWKDDDMWYLTRPMRTGDIPETHEFQESSSYGIWQGTITVVEHVAK